MTVELKGFLVPIATPFDPASGDVAPVALRSNAKQLVELGADGIVVAGSTGEGPLLNEAEFRDSLQWVREVLSGDALLVAGAGRESTRATVAACESAQESGADAVLVRAPSYFAPSLGTAQLLNHFRTVADESPLPLILYNMPKYTGVELTPQLIANLVDHPNIAGAKDSSWDLKNFAAYRETAPDWALFIGSGALYYAALELGAVGGILAVGNYAAPVVKELGDRFAAGDRSQAGRLQEKLTPLHTEIVGQMGIPGVKSAMDRVGLMGGPPRPPLLPLDQQGVDRIAGILADAGL